TLLTALERGSELRHDGALRSWLLRIATNRALAHRRRRRRIVALEVVDADGAEVGGPGPAAVRAMVLNAVHRLPPRMRAAIVLRYHAGCSDAEVAAILGRSADAVTAERRLALDRLRDDLGSANVADWAGERHAPTGRRPDRSDLATRPQAGEAGGDADDTVETVDPLEALLGRVLGHGAVPVDVPLERLLAAFAERRRRTARRRSLALLAVAVVLAGSVGVFAGTRGPDAARTPAPVGTPTTTHSVAPSSPGPVSPGPASLSPSSPGPVSPGPASPGPPIAALPSLPALPAGRVEIDHAEEGVPDGTVSRRWMGQVGAAGSYGVAWVCRGPGTFGYALGEEGTARLVAAPDPSPCDGLPRMATYEIRYPNSLPVYVTVDRRASWRLVVTRDPLAFSEPTPAASGTTSLDTPGAAVVVYVRRFRGAPILVVDAVGPNGDRGRIAEFDVPDVTGDADELAVAAGDVRFDGSRYLAVPTDAVTSEPRSDGTAVINHRWATLVFDLRRPQHPPTALLDASSAAWGPDGRLAYRAGGALRLLDPARGTESTVPIPDGVALAEWILGDGVWLADGSGFLTARQDPDLQEWSRGILTIDGTFRPLEGPTPAVYSPRGLPRRPAHGGEIAAECPEHSPDTPCSLLVSFGPGETPTRWWDGFGIGEWTADGRGVWVLEGVGQFGASTESRLVRVARPGEGEVVAAWEPPAPEAFAFLAGIAADDSAVLVGYTEPLPELRWIDVGGRIVRRVPGSFAGWVRP
ncbi:MAG TPA: sigma-70 family RNA polymerase sigma factor, partial [Candidatus Binatia bacterium]|nr:sigma-70 family RNA polymerase sigma factor [Candidatus Binatia bacterium]